MPAARTIQLFLMDGVPNGRMKATIRNWTGITYLLPRTTLQQSSNRPDLKQTGVYLLFGADDDGIDRVYIGQASVRKNGNGVLGRISEHVGEEKLDYWTHAVALVAADNSFGPTEISYLENRFAQLAKTAGRYVVTQTEPSIGNVTEEKQAELDEFIDNARIVIGALGHRVFEPADDANSQLAGETNEEPLLYMKYASYEAIGRQASDGFVVLAGSQLRPESEFTPSAPESITKGRERYRDRIGADMVLTRDVLLNSPSMAAEFVGGASLSGMVTWKTKEGLTLKEIEEQERG